MCDSENKDLCKQNNKITEQNLLLFNHISWINASLVFCTALLILKLVSSSQPLNIAVNYHRDSYSPKLDQKTNHKPQTLEHIQQEDNSSALFKFQQVQL